jgi:hypothetical protein
MTKGRGTIPGISQIRADGPGSVADGYDEADGYGIGIVGGLSRHTDGRE